MFRKLKWVRDGDGLWDLDMSTPATLNGVARPVPVPGELPVGLTRGIRLSRPKQVDFFQRFMFMPFIPSYSNSNGNGFCLERVLSFNLDRWFGSFLGQFNVEKFASNLIHQKRNHPTNTSSTLRWFDSIVSHLSDKSLYAVDLASDFFLTPNDSLLLTFERQSFAQQTPPRKKAVFHHKFAHHDLTVEAATPGLFVDKDGTFWDVPLTMSLDFASSLASSSDNHISPSYHFCINHNTGQPKQFAANHKILSPPPASLLPGFSATSAFSFQSNIDIWTSNAPKLKMVQPYDIFLSNPHISATGIIGGLMTACFGDNSVGVPPKGFAMRKQNCSFLADSFATVSLSAQLGNFQKMFFDLTRFQALLEFPSGSTFASGAARLAKDAYHSQQYNIEAIHKICPNTTLSFQQQLVGPFSFRVDSGVELDFKKGVDDFLKVKDPVFAVEYALQVLGSAKAVAWYSPRQKEFMIELRFFET